MERAEILRSADLEGLEVLNASYETFAFAPHRHAAHVLALIESGTHAFDHRGSVVIAPAGTIVFLDPDERHTGYGYQRSEWSYRVLYVEPAWFCGLAGAMPHFEPSAARDNVLADLIRMLCLAIREPATALERQALMLDIARRSLLHSDLRLPEMRATNERTPSVGRESSSTIAIVRTSRSRSWHRSPGSARIGSATRSNAASDSRRTSI
jgi:hypothetical protein